MPHAQAIEWVSWTTIIAAVVVCQLMSAILAWTIASPKDAGMTAFWLGLVFGGLGVVAALALDERPQCRNCYTHHDARALVCPACGAALKAPLRAAASTTRTAAAAKRAKHVEHELPPGIVD